MVSKVCWISPTVCAGKPTSLKWEPVLMGPALPKPDTCAQLVMGTDVAGAGALGVLAAAAAVMVAEVAVVVVALDVEAEVEFCPALAAAPQPPNPARSSRKPARSVEA